MSCLMIKILEFEIMIFEETTFKPPAICIIFQRSCSVLPLHVLLDIILFIKMETFLTQI